MDRCGDVLLGAFLLLALRQSHCSPQVAAYLFEELVQLLLLLLLFAAAAAAPLLFWYIYTVYIYIIIIHVFPIC